MAGNVSFESHLSHAVRTKTSKQGRIVVQFKQFQDSWQERGKGTRFMTTRRARRYQRGSICRSENGEVWYGKYYPAPGAPQRRVPLGRTSEMDGKQARTALD